MENIKKSYNNKKFKISVSAWNKDFQLPEGLHHIWDIQDYFKFIIRKHEEVIDNSLIRIYLKNIVNKIKFKIKR